ncbi:autotransporter domain-containing protein [Bosea sp. LjRoot237]|uniref:autotransporter domain-containing protein n=1 Tax=Bosea sp. LjRoot237 TaxID=3342292 RepID=UPI003ECC69C5
MTLPTTGPARAQDATWLVNPGSGDFFDANNWNPGSVPTGTASFGASNTTTLTLGTSGSFGGWTFNAGASNYTFNVSGGTSQYFTGAGLTINGGSAAIVNNGFLSFAGASTAGSATITNNGDLYFQNTSTAGSATINNNSVLQFFSTSTARNSTISNNNLLVFFDGSTAGSAVITNNVGSMYFYGSSTAGNASVANNGGLSFYGSSTAGNANITNDNILYFYDTSTAGNAAITNNNFLGFYNASAAGSATITNNSTLNFFDTSTAGSATITNNATLNFFGTGTAGNASITSNNLVQFRETSTAGNATIINGGTLNFSDASMAGSANIANNGLLQFLGTSTAGGANIVNNNFLDFYDASTAGSATVTNTGILQFNGTSTAGGATFNNTGALQFNGTSTAGSATFTNGGDLNFYASSTAGSANIVNIDNNSRLQFFDASTAGSATITNGGTLNFFNTSTAASATITNNSLLRFFNTSTAGDAALINNASGTVDFSNSTGPNGDGKLSAGSIAGAGSYVLGANELTVGSNNLSTEVSGAIFGSGSLVKTGIGTLTLTGANTYTGGTTINGGTLQLGNAGTAGSILGAVTVGNAATFDIVNADTSGITTISNNWRTYFRNSTSAGGATITNNNLLEFYDASTAGSATIANNSVLRFLSTSTADSATITNDSILQFQNTSTAGSATITNNATLSFYDTSTAGNASITNNNLVQFLGTSTAGSATIINSGSGSLNFSATSTAGSATITNNNLLEFLDTSTAGSAAITNNGGLYFYHTSTAGSANITNIVGIGFYDSSTAGDAAITNSGTLSFNNASTAGSATITNSGSLGFAGTATADNANIINNNNLVFHGTSTAGSAAISNTGLLNFMGNSTAGNAALINNAGGTIYFSGSAGPNGDGRVSAGSIAGAGNYILGANELTVGSNNLSTEVSGVISGTGSLVKTGTGTLTLTGNNTYTGGTTVAGGTLQFGNGASGGSINLAGSINVTGGTLAIQAPITLNVTQNVTFGDNTTLSIAAGATSPALSANSITIGNGVTFNISGITDASQLDMVLIDTTSGIGGDFASVSVGGFSGTVDYLTVSTRKSADGLQYLASYGLTWSAGNNLASGTFTLTNATDSFTVGAVLADQAANLATGWNGTSLTKAGAGTLILTGTNTYTGGTTISGGTLSVSRDANLGAVTGGLTFAGGTLSTTASFDTARAVSLTQAGGFDVATGTELGLTGVVSGSGDLIKQGGGTLRLDNGANAYGNTLVAAGTLIGNAASISGNIGNAGTVVFNQAGNASFSGDIAALNGTSGAMIKRGAGVLTLTGLSSLDWTIEAGGLVSSAERFGGNVAIASGASLRFDQAVNATYAGMISGTGSFTKAGAGLLTLTGNSSAFSGTTTIENGTLVINGSLGGTVDVLAGGRLQGSGAVSNMSVSGTIAPGNSIGTLNIAGNVTFAAGSIYEVEVNAAGQSDKIVAGGTATIAGSSVKVLADIGNYAPQTRYTILTANGGRSGTFSGVTSNLAFLDPSLSYDANNVYLTMIRNNIGFAGVGLTGSQIATGGGVESLGWGSPLYDAVVTLSAPQAQQAFEQLSGEIHASARTALIEDSRFIRNAVNDRIRAAFDAVGVSGTVSTYDGGKPVAVKANTDRFAVWGQAFGSWGHTNGDGNAARLNRKTGGFFFGADAPVFDTWRFGAVAGYSRTSFDVKDRRSSGSSDNYHVGLYGGTAWGDLAFRTGAAYAWHDVSTKRSVTFPGFGGSLKGDYNAATAQMFGELAYGFSAGSARFEPFANLAYVNLHTDGFTEQGGAAALTGASDNTASTFATLGLRASTTFDIGGTALTAKGMVGWRHAFGDMAPTSTMRFAGGGNAFAIGGIPIVRDAAVIEAGLDHAITPNATLGVSYGAQFGSGMSDQSAHFNFNVKF